MKKKSSIFMCHSSKDKSFVRKLAELLEAEGIRVWLDEAEIRVGDSLLEKIGRAIDETDFVAVVLSENSINSEWVQRELQVAIQREIAEKRKIVLPLLLDPVDVPPFLRDKLYADFTAEEKFDKSLRQLLGAFDYPFSSVQTKRQNVLVTSYQALKGKPVVLIVTIEYAQSGVTSVHLGSEELAESHESPMEFLIPSRKVVGGKDLFCFSTIVVINPKTEQTAITYELTGGVTEFKQTLEAEMKGGVGEVYSYVAVFKNLKGRP